MLRLRQAPGPKLIIAALLLACLTVTYWAEPLALFPPEGSAYLPSHPISLDLKGSIGAAIDEDFQHQKAENLKLLRDPAKCAQLVSGKGLGFLVPWDYFQPTNACLKEHRIGKMGDGGKWICMVEELLQNPGCVVYSIGSNGEVSFELAMHKFTRCDIHIFDPTLSQARTEAMLAKLPPERVTFHPWALGTRVVGPGTLQEGAPMKSLEEIMDDLGHTWIDVLKVDIEGGEWETFKPVFAPGASPPFTQLQIELHLGPSLGKTPVEKVKYVTDFFNSAEQHSYAPFHLEPNIYSGNPSSLLAEYALIKLDASGDIVRGPQSS